MFVFKITKTFNDKKTVLTLLSNIYVLLTYIIFAGRGFFYDTVYIIQKTLNKILKSMVVAFLLLLNVQGAAFPMSA